MEVVEVILVQLLGAVVDWFTAHPVTPKLSVNVKVATLPLTLTVTVGLVVSKLIT